MGLFCNFGGIEIYNLFKPFEIEHFEVDTCACKNHKHTFFEVTYILKGAGSYFINGNKFDFKASNQEMWQLDTLTAKNLFDEYTLGNSFVMYVDQVPAATFILQWKDPLYYAHVPDHTAGFIHKLAIRCKFAGQGIFAHILDFCRKQCLKRNIDQIQLETDTTRPSLMRFYEQYSFQPTYRKVIHEFCQTFTCQYYKGTSKN